MAEGAQRVPRARVAQESLTALMAQPDRWERLHCRAPRRRRLSARGGRAGAARTAGEGGFVSLDRILAG